MRLKIRFSVIFNQIMSILMAFSTATIVNYKNVVGYEKYSFINSMQLACIMFTFLLYIAAFLFLSLRKSLRVSKPTMILLGFNLWLAFITLINGGESTRKTLIVNISVVLWLEIVISKRRLEALKTYYVFYIILLIINFLSVFLCFSSKGLAYNDGTRYIYGFYFLNGKNEHCLMALPTIGMSLILFKRKWIGYSILGFSLLCGVLSGAASSIIMYFLWSFLIFYVYKYGIFQKLFKSWKSIVVMVAAAVLVFVVFQKFTLFSNIFMFLFSKDMTTQNRGVLFSLGLEKIRENWIFGYGVYFSDKFLLSGYASSHNLYLDTVLNGGIIALAIFIYIIVSSLKMVKKYGNLWDFWVLYSIIIVVLLGGFVEGYMTVSTWANIYMILLALMRWRDFSRVINLSDNK